MKGMDSLFSCKSYFTRLPPPAICKGSIKQSLNRPEASRENSDVPCSPKANYFLKKITDIQYSKEQHADLTEAGRQ